jgi:hypothetical protein
VLLLFNNKKTEEKRGTVMNFFIKQKEEELEGLVEKLKEKKKEWKRLHDNDNKEDKATLRKLTYSNEFLALEIKELRSFLTIVKKKIGSEKLLDRTIKHNLDDLRKNHLVVVYISADGKEYVYSNIKDKMSTKDRFSFLSFSICPRIEKLIKKEEVEGDIPFKIKKVVTIEME